MDYSQMNTCLAAVQTPGGRKSAIQVVAVVSLPPLFHHLQVLLALVRPATTQRKGGLPAAGKNSAFANVLETAPA